MAAVLPFRALRYNEAKAGRLADVVAQPYDKITPEMQRAYLRRSPYNLAHLTKGEILPTDTPEDNSYTRAARRLREWRQQGILIQHDTPVFFAYAQEFSLPGASNGHRVIRKGLVATGRAEPYGTTVFRHEQTLSAPKADRLELLRATRTHLESVFMLYSDPEGSMEGLLTSTMSRSPLACVRDEYDVTNMLWEIADSQTIRCIQEFLADKKLIIADGHHRYETALTYRQECERRHPERTDADCSRVLVTLVSMEAPGLVILPTHRVIRGLSSWRTDEFLSRAAAFFTTQEHPFRSNGNFADALQRMKAIQKAALERGELALGALFCDRKSLFTLHKRPEAAWDALLGDLSPAERTLDVILLHRILLAQCLGVDEESVRTERYLTYVRHAEEGAAAVLEGGAQACFFVNPLRIEQVRDIAFQGRLLPQKSTDFYPKLLSGLVMYPMED